MYFFAAPHSHVTAEVTEYGSCTSTEGNSEIDASVSAAGSSTSSATFRLEPNTRSASTIDTGARATKYYVDVSGGETCHWQLEIEPPNALLGGIDTTAPTATLSAAKVQRLSKTVKVAVACLDEPCTARASGRVHVPKLRHGRARMFTLRGTTGPVARGSTVMLKLGIPAKARAAIRRALRAHKRVTATIQVVVADAAGNERAITKRVRFRR
jgi:hypothetical protein